MPRIIGIIPARLGSTRFPAKVLAAETGSPLIHHVISSARRCTALNDIIVATDDQRVRDAAARLGTLSVMTRPDHVNGTSRLAEASELAQLDPDDLVVNIQGDEPEIEPDVIDAAIRAASFPGASIGTVGSPIASVAELENPNIVKVVRRLDGLALYFSRATIPFPRQPDGAAMRHVGIYAYKASFLRVYAALSSTPLERTESLEQLRALEHGYGIGVEICASTSAGIDTPEQYREFVQRWKARRVEPNDRA